MVDFNATQAAIRAGYSRKTAKVIASQNLTKINIQERVQELRSEVVGRNGVRIDDIVKQLKRLGFSDIRKLIEWNDGQVNIRPSNEIDDDAAATITEVQSYKSKAGNEVFKIKVAKKERALEMLARYLGMFEEIEKPDEETAGTKVVLINAEGKELPDALQKTIENLKKQANG